MAREATDFLYPFIEHEEHDASALLADLARSANGKWDQSVALRARSLSENGDQIEAAARAMAERFAAGGQLFTFGNGGSATDADAVAQLFTTPPWGTPLPARSLVSDQAVLTALANDIGFDVVFSRQLIAHGRPSDMALGLSTSGNSENLIMAFTEAKRRGGGVLTLGLAGYDGGQMAASQAVDHCIVVRSDSVHRIQEVQAATFHALWIAVQAELGDRRSP